MTYALYESNRNKRSLARDFISKFLNNLSISNMDSVRTQLGLMTMLSSQTDELSRNSLVNIYYFSKTFIRNFISNFFSLKNIILNQCLRLVQSLSSFSTIRPVDEVQKTIIGLVSTIGLVKSV